MVLPAARSRTLVRLLTYIGLAGSAVVSTETKPVATSVTRKRAVERPVKVGRVRSRRAPPGRVSIVSVRQAAIGGRSGTRLSDGKQPASVHEPLDAVGEDDRLRAGEPRRRGSRSIIRRSSDEEESGPLLTTSSCSAWAGRIERLDEQRWSLLVLWTGPAWTYRIARRSGPDLRGSPAGTSPRWMLRRSRGGLAGPSTGSHRPRP